MILRSSALITVAGSGPSSNNYGHVTIATKKRPCPSDYLMCRFSVQDQIHDRPLMVYYRRGHDPESYACDSRRWDKYFSQFVRYKQPPQKCKPSLGTCAVFAAIERWNPDEIGLIGFDNILDGNDEWLHDALAERRCIESLTRIVDLRDITANG